MRFYRIVITNAAGQTYQFGSLKGKPGFYAGGADTLTSLLPSGPQTPQQGLTNPAALQIELDIAAYNAAMPDSNSWLRIWGLGLQDIGSAANLNGAIIEVYAGMARGLPLANPQQAGLIMRGQILQAYGNWVGTDQTVDMTFTATAPTVDTPGNFVFSCPAGMLLGMAIGNTLAVALPNMKVDIAISSKLVQNYDQHGHFQTLGQFANFIQALSIGIMGDNGYGGVQIGTIGDTIKVSDGTIMEAPTAIAYTDLIGQPTWIAPQTISLKTVLRADIQLGDIVTIPPSLVTQTSNALTVYNKNQKSQTTFQGQYRIVQVHHYGNFRQPDAASWNTTYQMTPVANG